jgi:FMN phosphatase YigB (HAD superfamily)
MRPEETVMIGDSWTADVEGARSAGIRAIWFNRTGTCLRGSGGRRRGDLARTDLNILDAIFGANRH